MSQDKRKEPRIDFHLPVTIEGQQGSKKMTDLSLGGAFIHIRDTSQLKQGDEIDLVMKLPLEKNVIQVKARVMHMTTEGIGVEFVGLLPQHEMALEYCLHVFKHTVPLAGS
jgi:c-di-GMP-binding flagellar brake protein YcgR